jgi:hypothetical protein
VLRAVVVVVALTTAVYAGPAEDDLAPRSIVFARGTQLIKADARGRGETELATLPAKRPVRALRVDARGGVLLADVGGVWSWMPLDGSTKALAELPCGAGPAQLAEDGLCVLCRAKGNTTGSVIVTLATGKVTPIDVPIIGARLSGVGSERRVVWADATGVWSAPPANRKAATEVAPEPPLRHLAPSPDGAHALGVYADEVYENARTKHPGDVLMMFALDGTAARRKTITNGVPIEWSHDSKWVLVQDGNSACIMMAAGGQYKCWRGFTAQAIAPDGKYALLLGNRDYGQKKTKSKDKKKKSKREPKKKAPPPEPTASDEPSGEAELPGEAPEEDVMPVDDVPLPPPSGPLALFRAELEGAFTKTPQLVTRDVDGAAVWLAP